MKCLICGRTIAKKETRIYSWIGKRKVYSCVNCQDAFDAAIDRASIADLARIARTWSTDPKRAAVLVEAWHAGRSGFKPCVARPGCNEN